MESTIFWTVLSGVITYVIGQLLLKLFIEPVQEFRKTIGAIANALVLRANVIANPGVPGEEEMRTTSAELRSLSSQLLAHLYLIPVYDFSARVFRLPARAMVREASTHLIGLSNSVYRSDSKVYEANAARVERVSDCLGIEMNPGDRLSKDGK